MSKPAASSLFKACGAAVVLMVALCGSAFGQAHGPIIPTERKPGIQPGSLVEAVVGALERSHNLEAWQGHEAAVFDVELTLGEADPVACTVTMLTGSLQFVLSTADGPLLGRDDEGLWTAKDPKDLGKLGEVAPHLHMLGHGLAMPFRLRDPEMILSNGSIRRFGEHRWHAVSITHTSRDDWFILCARPGSTSLAAAAYFIRLSEDDEPEFSQAYAMVVQDTATTEDVILPSRWSIWPWSRMRGMVGDEPIGDVAVKSLRFVEAEGICFDRPKRELPDDPPASKP